jgi:hypothetical protein
MGQARHTARMGKTVNVYETFLIASLLIAQTTHIYNAELIRGSKF